MPDKNSQNENLACEQWEALLVEVLDGTLAGGDSARFESHAQSCAACAQLLDEAQRGQEWLRYLAKEPAVPQDLVAKILAQTSGTASVSAIASNATAKAMPRLSLWKRANFFTGFRVFSEPRLMMTAAMAFFSIALTLDLIGFHGGSLRLSDLSPTMLRSTIERQFATASRPVVRYYDHLRYVYELESWAREFRRPEERDDSEKRQQKEQPRQDEHGGSAIKNGSAGKDGGSLNEPQKAAPAAPVIAGRIMEAKLGLKKPGGKSARKNYLCVEVLQEDADQAGRSLA